jgi:hypothetical protein
LKLARSVRFVPSEFLVGAAQLTAAEPVPQVQVSVKLVFARTAVSVCVPDAALVPDQPPLAVQL